MPSLWLDSARERSHVEGLKPSGCAGSAALSRPASTRPRRHDDMSSRTVLITGASAGIGRALAQEFASQGHDLILVARSVDALRDLAAELGTLHGVRVVDIPMDLATRRSASELALAVKQRDL